jgi:hypothetical protein
MSFLCYFLAINLSLIVRWLSFAELLRGAGYPKENSLLDALVISKAKP